MKLSKKKKAMVITSFFKVQDNTSRLNSQITTSAKRRVGYDACLYITSLECNHAKLVTWTNIIYSFSLIVNLCKKNEVAMAAMHSRCCISITIHGIYTKHCTYHCQKKKTHRFMMGHLGYSLTSHRPISQLVHGL